MIQRLFTRSQSKPELLIGNTKNWSEKCLTQQLTFDFLAIFFVDYCCLPITLLKNVLKLISYDQYEPAFTCPNYRTYF